MTGGQEGQIGGEVCREPDRPDRFRAREIEEVEFAAAGNVPEQRGRRPVVRQLERLEHRIVAGGYDLDRSGVARRIERAAGEGGEVAVFVGAEIDRGAVR